MMLCPSCGQENRESATFCGGCGGALVPTCPNCGTEARSSARFCDACGSSLGAASSPSSTPTPQAAAALPSAFASGRYQVRRFLGEGAKKRVYLAHDTKLDRDVAIALIKTEGLDALGRQRVTQEAQAMGRLGAHPNIVSVLDLGEQDGQPYMVTELMAGAVESALREANGPLSLDRTLEIAKAVCRGLEFAHARNVVHRDLKPGNVWLTEDGTAKIGDFGLAVSLDRSRLTQHGMMIGTVRYMPPEQALGGDVTPRADLYSLGAMLYEMAAGRPPFLGDDPTAVLSQHINTPPVAPSWYTEHCPPDLEELILRLLAKDPGERPESAAEVLEVLERIDPAQKSTSHSESNVLDRLARGVFVGREQELERLRKAFDEAFAGRGSVVMLVGEPGIGKTRSAQELETYARVRGAQVLWGAAHEGAGAPAYWPFVQVGRSYGSAHDVTLLGPEMQGRGAALASIFPELRQGANFVEPEELADPDAAQFRLFDAYAAFIRAMTNQSPLLIALDDLHWADKPSLLLLQHLARELSRMRVLIVGTYRDTELVRTHPLSETLATLNRGPGFQRIVLRGLSRDEVAGYIRAVANVEPAREVLDRIFEETEGNPFFLSEVVNLMAQEGTLTAESVSDIAVPDGVREALGRRLDRISEEANELLQMAAVAGREFAYDTLTLLAERDENELLRLIEEGLDARVIEEMEQPGRFRFTHALMQETLLDELSTTRRVRLHGQVGEALERRWGARADERASRLAQHFVEAATVTPRHAAKAVRYSKLAAQQAEAQFAWGEAAKHYEACLTLVSDAEDRLGEDEAALLTTLGRCGRNDGNYRAAWRSLMRAITIYRQNGDAAGMARGTLEALRIPAPPDRQLALIQDALGELGERDPYLEARLLGILIRPGMASLMGEDEGARARQRLAALLKTHEFPDVQAQVLVADAFALRDMEARAALFTEAYEGFARLGMASEAADSLWQRAAATLAAGLLDQGSAAANEGLAYARNHHLRYYEENCAAWIGSVLLARCDFEALDALVRERASDNSFVLRLYHAAQAEMAGELDEAVALLPDPAEAARLPGLLVWVHGSRARILFNAGREQQAKQEFSRLREVLHTVPGVAVFDGVAVDGASRALLDEALPFLADDAFLSATMTLMNQVEAPPFDMRSGRSLQRTRGAMMLHAGETDRAEEYFRHALEWCERERCPVEAGRCLQGLADVAERRGNVPEALHLLDRAGELFRQHGARLYLDRVIAKKVQLQGIGGMDINTSIDAVYAAVQAERPDISVHAAPDGTVTMLFTDIEGSTPLNERLGDQRWVELLRVHNAIVRGQVVAHNGFEVKNLGDGFMVAFGSASRALHCAIALQRAFAEHNRLAGEPVYVRIGLHTGEAIREAGDFYGRHVTLAWRIADQANGGEILVSSLVRQLVESSTEAALFSEPREVELKGLTGSHRVCEVRWAKS